MVGSDVAGTIIDGAGPYQEVMVAAGLPPDDQRHSIEALIDRQVDGLILIAQWMETSWLEDVAARLPPSVNQPG